MVWLLIILALAIAISPLLWMKSSPRQEQIIICRKRARSLTINVDLCRRPDANKTEKGLEATLYWMSWQTDDVNESWVLHRRSKRGWESAHNGWRWVNQQADKKWLETIDAVIESFTSGVSAIIANKEGIGVIWDERGDTVTVENLHQSLIKLRKKGEEICT